MKALAITFLATVLTIPVTGNIAVAQTDRIALFAEFVSADTEPPVREYALGQTELVELSAEFFQQVGLSVLSETTFLLVIDFGAFAADPFTMLTGAEQAGDAMRVIGQDQINGSAGLHGLLTQSGLIALVETPDRTFRIEPHDGPIHLVYEVDISQLPVEAEPLVSEGEGPPAIELTEANSGQCDVRPPYPPPVGKGDRIRFLAVFTAAAAAATSDINGEIRLAFDLTTQAFQTANFNVFPILADIQMINLIESSASTDLRLMTNGGVPNLHAARDQAAADLVIAFTAHSDVCGIAWLNERPTSGAASNAFGIVNIGCAVSNKTAPHEIGHLLGMRHDRYVDTSGGLGYNFGYVAHADRLRSLMAYGNACTDAGYSCRRVTSYSSPGVTHKNGPLGVPIGQPNAAHNLEVLCDNSGVISNWR